MNYFRDLRALHDLLEAAYELGAAQRPAALAQVLAQWGFTNEQAALYASTVLEENVAASANHVVDNVMHVLGSWVHGEQQGMASAWLSTSTETWRFDAELTYERTIEKYEGYVSPSWSVVQSSYSRPSKSEERGIWAPSDRTDDTLSLFVMAQDGATRRLRWAWVDNQDRGYRACTIDGTRFARPYG